MNKIQEKILEIYKVIRELCINNEIRFYAIGGTAIGAEREHGFIPWDDDLDIAIPNGDYKRFIDICKKNLPEEYKLFLPEDSKHSLIFWGKVHDTHTAFLENMNYKYADYRYGIFVDVMPIYGVPNKIDWYNKKVMRYRTLSLIHRNSISQLSRKKRIAAILLKPLFAFLPKKYWLKKLEAFQSRYDFDKTDKTGYTWSILKDKLIFDREWFDDYYELPFENTLMRCCKGTKEMLTKQFGNYMEPPDFSQRVSNHFVRVIDLDHSYLEYNYKGELEK